MATLRLCPWKGVRCFMRKNWFYSWSWGKMWKLSKVKIGKWEGVAIGGDGRKGNSRQSSFSRSHWQDTVYAWSQWPRWRVEETRQKKVWRALYESAKEQQTIESRETKSKWHKDITNAITTVSSVQWRVWQLPSRHLERLLCQLIYRVTSGKESLVNKPLSFHSIRGRERPRETLTWRHDTLNVPVTGTFNFSDN